LATLPQLSHDDAATHGPLRAPRLKRITGCPLPCTRQPTEPLPDYVPVEVCPGLAEMMNGADVTQEKCVYRFESRSQTQIDILSSGPSRKNPAWTADVWRISSRRQFL